MTHTLKNKVLEIFKIKNLEYFINNGGACDMIRYDLYRNAI